MNANEIMKLANRDRWHGMGELIQAARRVHGDEWTRSFTTCEDCGRLLVDPAVFDDPGSTWVEVQVGSGSMDREGNPTGLPPCDTVCQECAKTRAPDAAKVASEEANESWRRARRDASRVTS